jgi:two-component system CheB/CheR fusion protein
LAEPRGESDRTRRPRQPSPAAPAAVVGVAASAANLPSLEALFSKLPRALNATFVVSLQPVDGLNSATVAEILTKASPLAAEAAQDGGRLQPNRIYVGSGDELMVLEDNRLGVTAARQPPAERGTIDSFFVTLAESQGPRAIGVLLHGLGSDGAAGAAALREFGGLSLAETEPAEDGRGEAAVETLGAVDFVLPLEPLAEKVASHVRHLDRTEAAGLPESATEHLGRIASILRNKTGHDFHGYKPNTFLRRIQRRMQVRQIDDIEHYVELLRSDAGEAGDLFQDLLIGVTQFFRDRPEFELLEREVVPKLFEGKQAEDQLRVWVLGCATGEEAYSIAMLLREHMAGLDVVPHVQIFATDIDARALAIARAGRYPEAIEKDVTPERLARWFSREGATYCVGKELREMCIFSQHNVIKDAPFSRIDLISCRNLLIYLQNELQDRVLPLFHFSLRPGGFLFLGPSENVTRHAKLFAPIDRRHRLFRRQETVSRVLPEFPLSAGERPRGMTERPPPGPPPRLEANLARRAERVAERYAPAYVLVDEHFDVLHFSGRTGRYLEPVAGAANLNILNLVHRDLRVELRAALHSAAADRTPTKVDGVHIAGDGERRRVDLVVEPIAGPEGPASFVVLFRDGGSVLPGGAAEASNASLLRDEHVQRLDAELRLTKERLQATIEELESTNEELKSSNEEYQSINEELQSANEELETSKEELQSVNEELQTVNGELAHRVHELARANSDLKNLLESTQIATVFLDNDLRVKSFTPSVADIFHLIDTDLGRPITHIASRIAYPELEDDVRRVLRTLGVAEREVGVPGGEGRYLVRVLPYRSIDNFIAGAVLTFLDVTATVRAEAEAADANRRMREILESIADAFYALDDDLRFTYVNRRALELWGRREDELIGRSPFELFPKELHRELIKAHQQTLGGRAPVEIELQWPGGASWMAINIYPATSGLSVFLRDVSERKRVEERQKLLMAELQHRVKNILAVVRSITTRTLEASNGLEDFAAHFDGRLGALARTQSVLARQAGEEIDLDEIVREELLSHAARENEQIVVGGPQVLLQQKAAETFSLAVHELATNAVKYGALSMPSGRVSVTWRVMNTSAGPKLLFEWRESGVPVVDPQPGRTGFGRDLIERGLPYDLPGAATALSFAPGGLQCVIELPLNQYAAGPFRQKNREGTSR